VNGAMDFARGLLDDLGKWGMEIQLSWTPVNQ